MCLVCFCLICVCRFLDVSWKSGGLKKKTFFVEERNVEKHVSNFSIVFTVSFFWYFLLVLRTFIV